MIEIQWARNAVCKAVRWCITVVRFMINLSQPLDFCVVSLTLKTIKYMYTALKNMKAINCPCLRTYWYIYYREIFSIWWVWNWVRVKIIYGMSIDWEKIVFWPCQVFRALVCMIAVRWRKCEGTVAYVYVCAAVGRRIFHQIHVQLISQWQSKTNMSFFYFFKDTG